MTLEKFDVLEEKVRQMTEMFVQLKNEKADVAQSVEEMKLQISALEDKTRSLEEEREKVRSRLDEIIANLESVSLKP